MWHRSAQGTGAQIPRPSYTQKPNIIPEPHTQRPRLPMVRPQRVRAPGGNVLGDSHTWGMLRNVPIQAYVRGSLMELARVPACLGLGNCSKGMEVPAGVYIPKYLCVSIVRTERAGAYQTRGL